MVEVFDLMYGFGVDCGGVVVVVVVVVVVIMVVLVMVVVLSPHIHKYVFLLIFNNDVLNNVYFYISLYIHTLYTYVDQCTFIYGYACLKLNELYFYLLNYSPVRSRTQWPHRQGH